MTGQVFKVGDRVKIREDSQYYAPQGKNGIGSIKQINENNGNYYVSFDNGYYNTYREEDLELIDKNREKTLEDLDLETTSNVRQIIEHLSRSIDLVNKFDDIRVLEEPSEVLAYTDVEHKTLYINSKCKSFDFAEIVKMLNGLVIHEFGHIDSRLKVPTSTKILTHVIEELGKGVDFQLLNILYDLEIHFQYNHRNMIKPTKRRELKEMITLLRNKCFKEHRDDIILSVEYPTTEFQQKVKEIVENRNLTIIQKYKKIKELEDKEEKKGGKGRGTDNSLTILILEPSNNDGKDKDKGKNKQKGKGKGKGKKEKKPSVSDKLKGKSISIKEDVNAQNQLNEVKQILVALGFSDEELDYICKKYSTKEIIKNVENLQKSFKDIVPELINRENRDKVRNHIKSKGNRFNGYHKINDFSEILENPEDLMTIGKLDLEEIRVPTKIKRKTKGIIFLLRDVSGSVSSPPLDKIVRDTTTTLVRVAKQKQHKIGVMDFHSQVEPIKDRKGEILTTDYNIVLFESMKLKSGYSTVLTKALAKVNQIIKEKKLEEDNLNLFIVTDSNVDLYEDTQFEFLSKKVNLVGVWCKEGSWGSRIDENFKKFIEKHNGKIYKVEQFKDRIVADVLDTLDNI